MDLKTNEEALLYGIARNKRIKEAFQPNSTTEALLHEIAEKMQVTTVEMLPETEVIVDSDRTGYVDGFGHEFVEGNEYAVKYNGSTYRSIAHTCSGEVCVGNERLRGGEEDTGEPFLLATQSNGERLTVVVAQSDITVTVGISEIKSICLPDNVAQVDKATVGQTIVVKEVDDEGKPTEWEAADYQPRTHYMKPLYPDCFISKQVNPAQLGEGVYQIVSTTDPEEFAYQLACQKVSYAVGSSSMRCWYFELTCETSANSGKYIELQTDSTKIHAVMLDKSNYCYNINTKQGLRIFVIIDLSTLTDEYKEMFTEVGAYLQIFEGSIPTLTTELKMTPVTYYKINSYYLSSGIASIWQKVKPGQVPAVKKVDPNGYPVSWEAKDMPEVAQSDWSETDETKPGFIKNRTHWMGAEEVFVEQQTFTAVYNQGGGFWETYIPITEWPDVGASARIEFDGVVIDGVVYEGWIKVDDGVLELYEDTYSGNPALNVRINYGGASNDRTHTIEIKTVFVSKLDERYLPDSLNERLNDLDNSIQANTESIEAISSSQPDMQERDETSYSFVKNKTHYEYPENYSTTEQMQNPVSNGEVFPEVDFFLGRTYTFILNDGDPDNRREISGIFHSASFATAGFYGYCLIGERTPDGYFDIYCEGSSIEGDRLPHMSLYTNSQVLNTLTVKYYPYHVNKLPERFITDSIQRVGGDVIIKSSTEGSTKKFKLTVNDSGTITATEVTE